MDPLGPVARAVITHAHGDHARPGSGEYLCAEPSVELLRRRPGFGSAGARIVGVPYGETRQLGQVRISFHPAGHILGSAQVRMERGGSAWLVSGDYKREADPSCAPFEVVPCDVLVTEATFGLPIFRWDDPIKVVRELFAWWQGNQTSASVLFCYALGKAQRILAELALLTDRPVWVHGAIEPVAEVYRAAGVRLLPTRLVGGTTRGQSFAGELVLAPITARGSSWMRRMGAHQSAFASGHMQVRGTRRRRGFDRGFVLSDHADWPGLLRTIRETGAKRVLVTHGHRESLARYLRESLGIDSGVIGPLASTDPEGD